MASRDKNGRSYGTGRTRNYATVVYAESAPADWQAILSELCISAFVSPYHDQDKNPDGTEKKPHWHVMIMFDTVKSKDQAREIFDKFGGVGCEVINSMRGYARYLCHLDNPEKHQYDKKDVLCFAGADYESVVGLPSDRLVALADMVDYINDNDIYSYAVFLTWCRSNRSDWFNILATTSSVFIRGFISSRYLDRKDALVNLGNSFSLSDKFVDYSPLFRFMGQRGMKKTDLLSVISNKTLAKIFNGCAVDFRVIQKICDYLQCNPGDVFAFSQDETAVPVDPKEQLVDEATADVVADDDEIVYVEPPVLPKPDRQAPAIKGNRYSRRHYKKVKAASPGLLGT